MQSISRPGFAALGRVSWLFRYVSPVLSLGLVGMALWMPSFVRAEDLKTIQQRGQLVVAVKEDLPPLGFRGPDGQLQGLEIDIAIRLAQELLGKPDAFVLKPVLNQERLRTVLEGQVDIAIARLTLTASRSRVVSFSIPYYLDGTALVTKDPALQTSLDLKTQTLAVLSNSSTVEILRNRLPQAKLVGVESYESARALLERGEVSAFAADASVLSGWVREFPQYRLLTPTLSVEPLCIV
ncbi:MAG: transporter substrate-binding domain-containing protein, partial [Kovacikia sp.]